MPEEFWDSELGSKLEGPGCGGGWGPKCCRPRELVPGLSALSLSVLSPVLLSQEKAFTLYS